jgi:hypothetical protein
LVLFFAVLAIFRLVNMLNLSSRQLESVKVS